MNPLAGMDMSRILLDLSNEVIKQLDDLEVQRNLPRADLLREAVDQCTVNQSQTARTSVPASGKGVRKMVSNTCVSCARNGNGKKIWLFDIDILIDFLSVKIEAKQALAA